MGSLNGQQCETDRDGVTRLVVAHRDPGVPNWLDPSGLTEGFLTPRWAYATPPDPSAWPVITAKRVAFDEIRDHLPTETRHVTEEERRATIRARRRHVLRRFRSF
jgi:hypothetical protein